MLTRDASLLLWGLQGATASFWSGDTVPERVSWKPGSSAGVAGHPGNNRKAVGRPRAGEVPFREPAVGFGGTRPGEGSGRPGGAETWYLVPQVRMSWRVRVGVRRGLTCGVCVCVRKVTVLWREGLVWGVRGQGDAEGGGLDSTCAPGCKVTNHQGCSGSCPRAHSFTFRAAAPALQRRGSSRRGGPARPRG